MYPFINVFGKLVSSYGVMMVLAVFTVCALAYNRGEKQGFCLDDIIITASVSMGGILSGSYLLYIFVTYSFSQMFEFVKSGDFSFLSNAGLVFYGGVIGTVIVLPVAMKLSGMTFGDICYIFVPFVPLGHAIGRVGCFLAGCCNGREYDGLFAVYYKNSIFGLSPEQGYFPVQLMEALLNVVICVILIKVSVKVRRKSDVAFLYAMMYAVVRFLLEYFRGDSARGFIGSFSTSQCISLLIFAVALLYFVVKKTQHCEDIVEKKCD